MTDFNITSITGDFRSTLMWAGRLLPGKSSSID